MLEALLNVTGIISCCNKYPPSWQDWRHLYMYTVCVYVKMPACNSTTHNATYIEHHVDCGCIEVQLLSIDLQGKHPKIYTDLVANVGDFKLLTRYWQHERYGISLTWATRNLLKASQCEYKSVDTTDLSLSDVALSTNPDISSTCREEQKLSRSPCQNCTVYRCSRTLCFVIFVSK